MWTWLKSKRRDGGKECTPQSFILRNRGLFPHSVFGHPRPVLHSIAQPNDDRSRDSYLYCCTFYRVSINTNGFDACRSDQHIVGKLVSGVRRDDENGRERVVKNI